MAAGQFINHSRYCWLRPAQRDSYLPLFHSEFRVRGKLLGFCQDGARLSSDKWWNSSANCKEPLSHYPPCQLSLSRGWSRRLLCKISPKLGPFFADESRGQGGERAKCLPTQLRSHPLKYQHYCPVQHLSVARCGRVNYVDCQTNQPGKYLFHFTYTSTP